MKLFPTEFVQQYLFMTVFIIPVVLLVIGSLGRKLARGRGWRRSDFLLGPDLILASLSVAFVNLLDIARDGIAFAGLRIFDNIIHRLLFFYFHSRPGLATGV